MVVLVPFTHRASSFLNEAIDLFRLFCSPLCRIPTVFVAIFHSHYLSQIKRMPFHLPETIKR
jgi:hypothetical protein